MQAVSIVMSLDCKRERRWPQGNLCEDAVCTTKKHETSNHFAKKPRNAVAQSPKCGWEGKDQAVLSYLRAERGDFPSPAWKACRKRTPLADPATSATSGPAASQPLGRLFRKWASALQSIMNMARSDTGKLEEPTKFHTNIEVKEFFLILSPHFTQH